MSFFSKIVENKGLVMAGAAAATLIGIGMYSYFLIRLYKNYASEEIMKGSSGHDELNLER